MKIPVYKEGMTSEQAKDVAYAERNILALYLATFSNRTWNDFVALRKAEGSYNSKLDAPPPSGYYIDESCEGYSRVISIFDGKITFHVPDSFDLGNLQKIEPNWDGHTTEEKWKRVLEKCGVEVEE